jgi:hypothetical protein
VLPKLTVQQHPPSWQQARQSHIAWIMRRQASSLLEQEMQTPWAIASHSQQQQSKTHWQIMRPSQAHETLHGNPVNASQRSCSFLLAAASSQRQEIRHPFSRFSIEIRQRIAAVDFDFDASLLPAFAHDRSFIIALVIAKLLRNECEPTASPLGARVVI